ncbi:MAG: type II toxin-antitoxin system ParD family antitoxin [Phycisphaerales bacterium]
MAKRKTMNVSLPPALGDFVAEKVASGRFGSASEVVRAALRLLEQRQRQEALALKDLRKKIREGMRQAERGQLMDGDEFFEQLRRRRPGTRRKAG